MSDEPYDCVPSFKILFIVYGIITGLLILFTILVFVPFTILFGFIIPRRRVRASSPLFLLIIIVSGVFGYGSTYAWYGKPQSVACGFQPWLLGLAIVSMNSLVSFFSSLLLSFFFIFMLDPLIIHIQSLIFCLLLHA